MIDSSATKPAGGRSIARTLQVSLLAMTIVLAVIGAIGIAALYDARQRYEDRLAEAAELQIAGANLLASTVALEANLAQRRSRATARFVAAAAQSFERGADRVGALAAADASSAALADGIADARRVARTLAASPTAAAARARAARALRQTRTALARLAERQEARRAAAHTLVTRESRRALLAIAISAGLAVLGVLAFIALTLRAMRRPLDDLVAATRRMAAGDLVAHVQPSGPRELQELGAAFNSMGASLAEASARVESQRERLATTIRSLGDGLVICDNADRITSLNPRASALMPGLRVGAPAHGAASPLPQVAAALAGEVTIEHGRSTIAVTAARLVGPDGGTVWTLRDITERARLEQAKSDFVATASHELRSPLTSIKGFIELLQAQGAENLTDRQREFIQIVLESTDRLVELVNDLLDVARIESGQFEIHARAVDLRETIEDVASLMQPRLQAKRQRLEVEIAEARPTALADPARVRQIVTNLVTNAHLYTPEDGVIGLRLDGQGAAVRITVRDTGRGMAPDEVERIFDRFYRGGTNGRKTPGTGLGLAIVKSLVDLHGGTIAVDSAPGRGTTFTVLLPAAPASTVPDRTGVAATPPALAQRRVLVVDDEPELAELIAEQLEPLGVRTVRAHSGSDALARLRAESFDAVTLDILMPGMNGFDVLREMRAAPGLRDIPVVFVSVSSRLAELEGEWAVSKPIDRRRLVDVLEAAIQARRSRVLVAAPADLRGQLEPALERLGIEHRWCTSADEVLRAGAQELFEVALVHASLSALTGILDSNVLRGRRRGRSVILFAANGDPQAAGGLGMPVFPLPQAVDALRAALGFGDARGE